MIIVTSLQIALVAKTNHFKDKDIIKLQRRKIFNTDSFRYSAFLQADL